jgi:hypothetical protein
MLGICTPQVHQKRRPLAAMAFQETDMSIKGLKEALARKQAQQHPDGTVKDSAEAKITPGAPVRVGASKPQKKAAGRGR